MVLIPTFVLLSLLTFVSANPRRPTSQRDCRRDEFFYHPKTVCLHYGGPFRPPYPPPHKECPPTNWYWDYDVYACVPRYPLPPRSPPPQCGRGWEWNRDSQWCEQRKPTPVHRPPPKPSPKPYDNHEHHKREAPKSRQVEPCPNSMEACPISSLDKSEYECVDTYTDLHSCGGCTSTGAGQDCGAIEGAGNVGCDAGQCKIYTCANGYKKSQDGSSCVPA